MAWLSQIAAPALPRNATLPVISSPPTRAAQSPCCEPLSEIRLSSPQLVVDAEAQVEAVGRHLVAIGNRLGIVVQRRRGARLVFHPVDRAAGQEMVGKHGVDTAAERASGR